MPESRASSSTTRMRGSSSMRKVCALPGRSVSRTEYGSADRIQIQPVPVHLGEPAHLVLLAALAVLTEEGREFDGATGVEEPAPHRASDVQPHPAHRRVQFDSVGAGARMP